MPSETKGLWDMNYGMALRRQFSPVTHRSHAPPTEYYAYNIQTPELGKVTLAYRPGSRGRQGPGGVQGQRLRLRLSRSTTSVRYAISNDNDSIEPKWRRLHFLFLPCRLRMAEVTKRPIEFFFFWRTENKFGVKGDLQMAYIRYLAHNSGV